MTPEHAAEHVQCSGDGFRAEYRPADHHSGKGHRPCKRRWQSQSEIAPRVIDDQIGTVERAPDHECPAGTMPESAKQQGYHQIDVATGTPASTPAERDVQVVPEQKGQRDMP